jgi:diguanylate cyclase (GGDEF)-like protein/PAS domain S-box-containing protein
VDVDKVFIPQHKPLIMTTRGHGPVKSERKTKQQLIDELASLKSRVIELEVFEKNIKEDSKNFSERIGRYFPQSDHASEAIYVVFDRKYEFINHRFAQLFEIKPEEACRQGFDMMKLVAPESRSLIREKYRKGMHGEYCVEQFEFAGLTLSGKKIECETFMLFIPYKWGMAIHGMLRDISMQKRIIEELQRHRSDLQIILDSIPTSIFYMDTDHRFLQANKAFCKSLGYPLEDIIGKSLTDLFPNLPSDQLSHFMDTNNQVMVSGNAKRGFIEVFPSIRGRRWIQNDRVPYRDPEGNIIGVICLTIDVSDLRETEEKLWYMSLHDVLTGLYNLTYFEEEIVRLEKSRKHPVSIVVVRVDDLVDINNREGIAAGNELLKRTARIMKNFFRSEDVVARIGGDTFGAIMPVTDKETGEKSLERLKAAIHAYAKQRNRSLNLSAGAATGRKGDSLLNILEQAKSTMRTVL